MAIVFIASGGENYASAAYADKRFSEAGTPGADTSARGVDMLSGATTVPLSTATSTVGLAARLIGSGGTGTTLLFQFRNGSTEHLQIYSKAGNSELRVDHGNGAGDVGSGIILYPSAEYHLEVYMTVHDTTGAVVVRANGKTVISLTNIDTRNGATTTVDNIRVGAGTGLRACDFVVQDTASSAIGDCNVDVKFASRAGDYTQFTSNAPAAAGEVWQVDADGGPSYSDQTTGFNDATDANFTPFPATEATGDYVAFGYSAPFTKLTLDNANGTAGSGGVVVWEYWDGGTWSALSSVTDGTTGFTAAAADGQIVTWAYPSDWATTSINGGSALYYARARITTVYGTNPVYDQGFIANNSLNVDEDTPDTTTYNASSNVGDRDSFGHAGDFALTAHTIKAVQVVNCAFKDDSGSREMEGFVRVNSTDGTSGASYALAQLDPQYFYAIYAQDPDAGPGAWTNSALNIAEMGYRLSA